MRRFFVLAAFVLPLMFAGAAYADSLDFSTPVITPIGTDFLWSYTVSVDQAEHINTAQNPAFITLYDVSNIVSTPTYTNFGGEPTGTVSVQNVGITPFDQAPTDNPLIPNITVSYTGTAASTQTLGVLSFFDSQSAANEVSENFSAEATLNVDNAAQGNTSSVPVPAPEPSTIAMFAMGMIGLASRFIRR